MAWVIKNTDSNTFFSRLGNFVPKLKYARVYKTASGAARALARRYEDGSAEISELGILRVNYTKVPTGAVKKVATSLINA